MRNAVLTSRTSGCGVIKLRPSGVRVSAEPQVIAWMNDKSKGRNITELSKGLDRPEQSRALKITASFSVNVVQDSQQEHLLNLK
jgi:hypothetical protein